MTLTIIAGTHTFIDLTGRFRSILARSAMSLSSYNIDGVQFKKRMFDRVEITHTGEVKYLPSRIYPIDRNFRVWTVSQPTGSLKTVLAVYNMSRVFKRGGNIAANLSYQYFENNLGKPPEEWTPNVQTIEDFMNIKNSYVLLDDIKGTAESWQAEESVLIGHAANLARKGGVDIDITSQGVTNFVAPNIRRVTTALEIPYCTIRDKRRFSPDGRGYPYEAEVISLIPGDTNVGDIFVGLGLMNQEIPDNRILRPSLEMLNSYRTMEVATGLKKGKGKTNRPGKEGEEKLLEYLKFHYPDIEFNLKNGKGVFDIECPNVFIDHVGIEEHGTGFRLNIRHKNISKHKDYSALHKTPAYIVYPWKDEYKFLNIKSKYLLESNPMIRENLLKASRSRIAVFG